MKRCPFCAEEVQDAAIVCKHCGRDILSPQVSPHSNPKEPAASRAATQRPSLGFAPSNRRNISLVALAAAVILAFPVATLPVSMIVAWVAFFLLFRGRIIPRFLLALVLAGLFASVAGSAHIAKNDEAATASKATVNRVDIKKLEQQMRTAMAAENWESAQAVANLIRRADARYPALQEVDVTINQHVHVRRVSAAIVDARSIVSDPKRCDTAKAIAETWTKLKETKPSDSNWIDARQAAAGLERCRQSVEKTMSKGLQGLMVAQREAWRTQYENGLLKQGINADVTLLGAAKDQVRIKWALISKAAVYQITDGGQMGERSFLGGLQKIGFRKVTFTDGYDDTWYYTLEPSDESNGGKIALAQMGLGEPLILKP